MKGRKEIEDIVSEILSKHRIVGPAVPIEAIAVGENLPVVESAFGSDVSGALIRSNGFIGIAVNGSQHPNRKRFTVAHEYAHYALKHSGGQDHIDWKFTILRRDGKSSDASDTREMEANFFAASILMPREFLRRDLKSRIAKNGEAELTSDDISMLSKRYQVSETAMKYRLMNLGFMSPI